MTLQSQLSLAGISSINGTDLLYAAFQNFTSQNISLQETVDWTWGVESLGSSSLMDSSTSLKTYLDV